MKYLFRYLLFAVLLILLIFLPRTQVYAGVVTYPQETNIHLSATNITLAVEANSSSDVVVVNENNIVLTITSPDSFVIRSDDKYVLSNDAGIPTECQSGFSRLTIAPSSGTVIITITPSTTVCSIPSAPGTPTTTSPTTSNIQTWIWTAATDTESTIASYTWRVTDSLGQLVTSDSTTLTQTATNLGEGFWNFFVKAINSLGFEGVESHGTVTVIPEPSISPSLLPSSGEATTSTHSEPSPAYAPTCTDTTPVGQPDLFQMTRTKTAAKLYFTPVNDNVEKYHVIFGLKKGDERFGSLSNSVTRETNNGVQSLTISDLNPKSEYWFKVAPVNGCAVGTWSSWAKAGKWKNKASFFYKYFHL